MKYRSSAKSQREFSVLGYGCMRFPMSGNKIDEAETEKLLKSSIERGVNYFDTAYIYHGGKSESLLGDLLNEHKYEVMITTKLPQFIVRKSSDIDKYFDAQMKRLKRDYVDYYFMHMLCDLRSWERLKRLGIEEWLQKKRESGQIKGIGFSYHGGPEEFKALVDAYDWDMCQIQYNYLDENNQAGRSGLVYASQKGLPVAIMEPLRGGNLVNSLPQEALKLFENAEPKFSPAQQGLRWIWNQSEPTVVLSGMSNFQQLDENIAVAETSEAGMLSEAELKMFENVKRAINSSIKVGCTGCRYCMPCPNGVNIPECFSCYNEKYTIGRKSSSMRYMQVTGAFTQNPGNASRCTSCGACEKRCPQGIQIRKKLRETAKELEGIKFKAMSFVSRTLVR